VILNAITVWNDFLTPLLYLSGSGNVTIPVALYGFVGDYVQQWNLVFAGLLISAAPVLIVYFLMQKSIIKGFAGGLKG
jgi:raffinose/stachyose/melibiose transport system permease protein